jgi:hypothetical protein
MECAFCDSFLQKIILARDIGFDNECNIGACTPPPSAPLLVNTQLTYAMASDIETLVSMGFPRNRALVLKQLVYEFG